MVNLTAALICAENEGADPASITTLHLPRRDLHEVSGLDACDMLVRLDLSNNHISNIEALSFCKNLKWLSVSGNGLKSLKGIEGLSRLSVLNGSRNGLTSMDEVAALVELRALILNDNEIKSPCQLDKLTNLNTLVLSRNPICNLGKALKKLSTLSKLSLSNCKVEVVGRALKRCSALKELRLAHNQLKSLSKELEQNQQLHILDLGNNLLQHLSNVEVLGTLHYLKNLNLRGNPLCNDKGYQKKVIRLLPWVQVLDGCSLKGNCEEKQQNFRPKGSLELINEIQLKRKAVTAVGTRMPNIGGGEDVVHVETDRHAEADSKKESRKMNNEKKQRMHVEDDEGQPFLDLIGQGHEDMYQQLSKRQRMDRNHERHPQTDSGVLSVAEGKKSRQPTSGGHRKPAPTFSQYLAEVEIGKGGPSSWDEQLNS